MKRISYILLFFLFSLVSCNEKNTSSGIMSTVARSFEYALENYETTTSISIKEKGIETIPEQIDERFTKLVQLVLNDNKITRVPNSIGNIPKLKMIHLDNNLVSFLPKSLEKLENLETLQLNKNKLSELPNVAFRFNEKARFSLRWNNIKALPSLFCYSRFGYLHLTGNPLTELPEEFGNIQGLKELNIANTNIFHLPESFYKLLDLRNLDVRGTKLSKEEIEIIKEKLPDCFINSDFN